MNFCSAVLRTAASCRRSGASRNAAHAGGEGGQLIKKVIPLGTVVPVKVVDVRINHSRVLLVCVDALEYRGEAPEGYLCLYDLDSPDGQRAAAAKKDHLGKLTFTEGGPEGGYWNWMPKT
ncbi:MAG: hypothetical protein MOB07_31480 [Acidobacteria bacterium]|nr:hypothetical protein [Acidobacteriota bacterium]